MWLRFVTVCLFSLHAVDASNTWMLKNVKTLSCLTVSGGDATLYANSQGLAATAPCDCKPKGTSPTQFTNIWPDQEGKSSSTLQNALTQKCITVSGGTRGNGVAINQYDCVGAANQNWKISSGDMHSYFQLQSSVTGQCMTAEGGGSYIDQWDCLSVSDAPHQYWWISGC